MIEIELSEKLANAVKNVIPVSITTTEEERRVNYSTTVTAWKNDRVVQLQEGTPEYVKELYNIAGNLASSRSVKNVVVVNNNSIRYTAIHTKHTLLYDHLEEFLNELYKFDAYPVVVSPVDPVKETYYAATTEEYS